MLQDATPRTPDSPATELDQFRAALSGAPVVLFMHDPALRYVWVHNPAFGTPTTFLGRTDADFLPPEAVATLTAVKERALISRQVVRDEVRFEVPGRGLRDYVLSVVPVCSADGSVTGLACAAVDVTRRRRAEEALQVRTAQLDFVLRATGVGLWLNPMPLGELNWDARTRELAVKLVSTHDPGHST